MVIKHPWQGDMMEGAFMAFVAFCMRNRLDEYLSETGDTFTPGRGIDAMIDAATGADEAFAQRFVDWCLIQFGTPQQVHGED